MSCMDIVEVIQGEDPLALGVVNHEFQVRRNPVALDWAEVDAQDGG